VYLAVTKGLLKGLYGTLGYNQTKLGSSFDIVGRCFRIGKMKMTNKQIRLDRIIDVLSSAQGAYECLAATTPLIRDPDKFSIEHCRMSFVTRPPVLVRKKDGYYLVSGYREWQMALRLLDKTEKVSCAIITDASTDFLNEMAWHEVYGNILQYGLSPANIGYQLRQMVKKLDKDIKKKYFPELSNIALLVKVTDIGRSTYFEKGAKTESKAKSYDDVLKDISAEQSPPKKSD
jgi:hypothetical protein